MEVQIPIQVINIVVLSIFIFKVSGEK